MKRPRLSAFVRPLVLLGVVVASACGVPTAPGSTTSASLAPTVAATSLRQLPRGIMLSKQGKARARPAGGSAPQRIPAGHDVSGSSLISYFGGPVISNVHVVAVDWTDTIDPTNVVDPVVSSTLPGFFATVTTSPYFSWLAEYSTTGLSSNPQTIGYGTFDTTGPGPGGTYIITPVINTTKTVDDSDIAAELNYQIEKGLLPAPQKDAKSGTCNSLYVVDFPPTIEITLGGTSFCTTFCGYHNSFHYAAAGVDIPYSVHPDLSSCSGCKVDPTDLESSESVHSHELVEATTDPNPESTAAWTSYPAGEVADVCASDADGVISGYDVQPIWSNANGACIVVAPLCDAITPAPPSCTPCTTTGAASCSGTIPLCEADITSANFGQCVGCLSETDCNGSTPFCDTSTKMCRACKAGDCTAPKGLCGALGFDLGQCVQCDSSSTTACTGATPACDTASFTCVACVVATDCPASTPFCDDTTLNCRKCTSTTDCPGGLCDSATGACVQCISSTDCGTETCNLSTHTCQCENSSQCANPAPVCGSSKSCGACQGSGDCAGNAAGSVCSGGSCVECVKSSDCPAGTPVCNPKTNQCRAAGGVDAGKDGAGPPVDSGKKKDGAADGGTITTSGGCSAAPSGASDGTGATPWLVMAGLAVLGRKRRRHA